MTQSNKKLKKLVEEGVTADKWRDWINHVMQEESNLCDLDNCIDVVDR